MLLLVSSAPAPQTFAFQGAYIPDLWTCPTYVPAVGVFGLTAFGIALPEGALVSYHWAASASTEFLIQPCSGNDSAYAENGTSGSGTFIAQGGIYVFGDGCPGPGPCPNVDVWGYFVGPEVEV